jgi:hypothetical protein
MDYDFADHNPGDIMTADEQEHFDEAMSFKNKSASAATVTENFEQAVESTIADLDRLLS